MPSFNATLLPPPTPPPAFAETFRANYFTALDKDLSDLAKQLRPLGIGFPLGAASSFEEKKKFKDAS
jgi:hypothetical protein